MFSAVIPNLVTSARWGANFLWRIASITSLLADLSNLIKIASWFSSLKNRLGLFPLVLCLDVIVEERLGENANVPATERIGLDACMFLSVWLETCRRSSTSSSLRCCNGSAIFEDKIKLKTDRIRLGGKTRMKQEMFEWAFVCPLSSIVSSGSVAGQWGVRIRFC